MNNGRFTLLEEGKAYFTLSLVNGGYNGVMVGMTVLDEGTADLQFDDWSGAGVSRDTSEAMKRVIQGNVRHRKTDFDTIPEGEVVWRPDDRCMEPGPARGFLAFQKRTCGKVTELLCMAMKKEEKHDPEDDTLMTPTVLFVPPGGEKEGREHAVVDVTVPQWNALCYLVARMRRESLQQAQSKHIPPFTLENGLTNSENVFLTTFLPENIARIKSVFNI